jgi:hypothetical protein
MGVGGISVMSTDASRRTAVEERHRICGVAREIAGRRERRDDAVAARARGLSVLEIEAIMYNVV